MCSLFQVQVMGAVWVVGGADLPGKQGGNSLPLPLLQYSNNKITNLIGNNAIANITLIDMLCACTVYQVYGCAYIDTVIPYTRAPHYQVDVCVWGEGGVAHRERAARQATE